MKTSVLVTACFVGAASVAVGIAQQAVALPVTDAARQQVRVFERNLLTAIEGAADQLDKRVRQVSSLENFQLQFEAAPVVTGVLVPDYGAVFYIQIPNIEATGVAIMQQRVRPASTAPSMFDPDGEYTTLMHAALVDTLLDNALSVPIKEGEMLTLIAGDITSRPVTGQIGQSKRKLILRIKGEDLISLRFNRLSRDDAKAKIMESRY